MKKSGMKRQSLNEPRNRNDYTEDTIPKEKCQRYLDDKYLCLSGKTLCFFSAKTSKTCILAGCPENGLILDPFMGSGTVGMVAKKMSRQYIGIEINRDYCQLAKKKNRGRKVIYYEKKETLSIQGICQQRPRIREVN